MPEINLPDIHAEMTAVFHLYEEALVVNDVTTLNELFWHAPQTLRYSNTEILHGYEAIAAYRRGRPAGLRRRLRNTVITTFGRDLATASTEFVLDGEPRLGMQSQTWVRFPAGWRIVAAHVGYLEQR